MKLILSRDEKVRNDRNIAIRGLISARAAPVERPADTKNYSWIFEGVAKGMKFAILSL